MTDEPWVEIARERRRRPAGRCLNEEQAIAFQAGELAEEQAEALRSHVAECPSCLELVRDARAFLDAMESDLKEDAAGAAPPAAAPAVRKRPWQAPLAASAALLLLGLGLWRGLRSPEPPPLAPASPAGTAPARQPAWADLPLSKAPYVPRAAALDELTWRDGDADPSRSSAAGAFARAMQPYEKDDFAEAARRLGLLVAQRPRYAEAHFYRGVSLLLLGRPQEATAALERADQHGSGVSREELLWYQALAYLKTDAPEKALAALEAPARGAGPHRAEAQRLREVLLRAPRR